MLTRRLTAILLTGLLLAAACGGDDGASPADDQQAADDAIAALERTLDEEGFTASADDDDDDDELEFESEDCQEFQEAFPGDDDELPGETASAESPDFERGEVDLQGGVQESVQASVGFTEEEDDLDVVFELLGDDRLPGCLEEAFAGFLEQASAEGGGGFEISDVAVERADPSGLGDEAARLAMGGTIGVQGVELGFAFDIEVVRVGRAAAMVMYGAFGEAGTEVDDDQRTEILEQLVGAIDEG